MKKWIMPLLLSLCLSACGFHLRGMINIPTWLKQVAIISKSDEKQLSSILKARLSSYPIEICSDPLQATHWLIINAVNVQQQIISVGASTNPRQYTLTLSVNYSLETRKGEIIKAPQTISISRQLTINNDRILGSTAEETILIDEMKQDAAAQILNQLSLLN